MKIEVIKPKNLHPDYEDMPAFEQVLWHRGIGSPSDFFNLSYRDVQSPYDLDFIEAAADKILYHLRRSSDIAVIVDCDCDGFSSSALLVNYIEMQRQQGEVGPNQTWDGNLPKLHFLFHEDKTHGLDDIKIMKELRDNIKPQLLIIPDASGTAMQYEALNELGIDIVVLDHHETTERGDGVKTIVVNNQQSEKYRNKSLSGVGVVYQLCRVLDDKLELAVADSWADLVAIGLVADVMDLRSNETRYLVLQGIKPNRWNSFTNYAVEALNYSLKGKLTPTGIGFYIGPLFNAVNRIGTLEEKKSLFYSLLDDYAEAEVESGKRGAKGEKVPLVSESFRLASNAKARQKKRETKLTELIDELVMEECLDQDAVIIVKIDDANPEQRPLAGLVANQLQSLYNRPAILLFPAENGIYSGSVRAPENIEAFNNFRQQCLNSKLVKFASGHELAFGLGIEPNKIPQLREYFNNKYADINRERTYYVDFMFDAVNEGAQLSDTVRSIGEKSGMWGQGVQEPLLAVKRVRVSSSNMKLLSPTKSPTIKITLNCGVEFIKFGASQEEYDALLLPYVDETAQCYELTIIGVADINKYNGNTTPQIRIKELEMTGVHRMF